MALTKEFQQQIDDLVKKNRVVLFMKGSRQFPQCGFSAKIVGMLDELVRTYETVNVLDDPQMRDGIKEYSQWPTIPQLYIAGQFVGGCDIVTEMRASGQLRQLIGAASVKSTPSADIAATAAGSPQITVTAAATKAFREASPKSERDVLRLEVSSAFKYDLTIDPRAKNDVEVRVDGVTLFLDPASASRASGVTIDFVQTSDGGAFKITRPNEPHAVKGITATDLKAWFEQGRKLELFDVRPGEERAIAKIDRGRPLDPSGKSQLLALDLDKKTPLIFHCHHGTRSRKAAEDALRTGFHEVYYLEGGIDAWSLHVDPSVPRY